MDHVPGLLDIGDAGGFGDFIDDALRFHAMLEYEIFDNIGKLRIGRGAAR